MNKKSLIEIHIAVIIMSATPLFVKLITLSPTDIIAFRCLIASLEPIYGMAFAALILSEIPAIKTIAGGIIVVGAAVYTSIRAGRTE